MVAEGTNTIRIGGYEQAPEVLLQTLQRRVHLYVGRIRVSGALRDFISLLMMGDHIGRLTHFMMLRMDD
jgi:hypothetical protein